MATVNLADACPPPASSFPHGFRQHSSSAQVTSEPSPQAPWAIVTGAGTGIGRAISLQLADQGYHLWLVDLNPQTLEETATQIRQHGRIAHTRQCDLADAQQIDQLCEEWLASDCRFALLVNNAGVAYHGPTLNMQDDQWDRILNVNLHAPARLCRRLLPRLLDYPGGRILNIASILGLVAHRKVCAYNVAKFGLVGLSESLRAEFGPAGLGVTTVCPGFVDTPLFERGMVGQSPQECRRPPSWLCTTPDRVARKALRALAKNRRVVLVTPLAHILHGLKRFAPGVIDLAQQAERLRLRWKQRRKIAPNTTPAFPVPAPLPLPPSSASLARAGQ